ncbi:MAG: hypothetical protein K9M75_05035 [Phycisphaerae bacterium]|nr:hypothetical protein [Phycisphaerae bacterium]
MNSSTVTFEGMSEQSAAIGIVFILIFLLIGLAVAIISAVVYCKICSKTGYHWALGLLMFVPIANLILPLILAFSEWPIHRELRACKRQTGETNY